jgi:peroxiredoxin
MKKVIFLFTALTFSFWALAQKPKTDTLLSAKEFSAKDLDGNLVKLSDYQGKVVVLNFWFIKCPPCVKEMPGLNKLKKKYARKGVAFIAVTFETAKDVIKFLQKNPFNFTMIADAWDIIEQYEGMNLGFPVNYIITKEGKIHSKHIGGVPTSEIELAVKQARGIK